MTYNISVPSAKGLAPPGSASINVHEFLMMLRTHGVEVGEPQASTPLVDIVARWRELMEEPIPLGVLRDLMREAALRDSRGIDGPTLDDEIVATLADPDLELRVVRIRRGRR